MGRQQEWKSVHWALLGQSGQLASTGVFLKIAKITLEEISDDEEAISSWAALVKLSGDALRPWGDCGEPPACSSPLLAAQFAEILIRSLGSGIFASQYHPSSTQETSECLSPSRKGSRKALVLGNYPVLLVLMKAQWRTEPCVPPCVTWGLSFREGS